MEEKLSNAETTTGLQVQLLVIETTALGKLGSPKPTSTLTSLMVHEEQQREEECPDSTGLRETQIYTDVIAIESHLQLHINSYKNNLTLHKMSF